MPARWHKVAHSQTAGCFERRRFTLRFRAFEGAFGRTPAKFLTGTKVVDVSGGPARFSQILGRTFSRLVPFEAFSFLGSGHGWHDRWSNTRVVRTRRV